MKLHEIRRHDDGPIDFDFYRAQARSLRAQAMRDAFTLKATFNFTLIVLCLIVGVTFIAATPAHWI
jgi:hypothetical protein